MKFKKSKVKWTLIVICLIFATTSISAFARGNDRYSRRNGKNGIRNERRWRWWEDDEEEEEKIADATVDVPTSSEINNSTSNGDIGYKKVSESSSSAASSANVCSSASAFKSAVESAKAGSVIYMKGGTYSGVNLSIDVQGSSSSYITIKNYPGDTVTFTNSTVEFGSSAKYIKFEGFIFKDYTPNDDWGACISFCGGASNIQFRNNEISNVKCRGTGEVGVNAIVLTGDSSSSINNVIIENNYVYNCKTGWSEAITTDGNVENCVIKNNTVDNTGNIGIDLCGNFSWTGKVGSDTNQSRNILVTKNKVMNCNSDYATSAGLYCDGGRDNTFSYNMVYNSQCGIELGAEEKGADVKNFTVNNNIIVTVVEQLELEHIYQQEQNIIIRMYMTTLLYVMRLINGVKITLFI